MPSEKSTRNDLKRLATVGGMALEMALSVAAGTVLGYLLDMKFKTSPLLTIIFMFVGVAGGIINFILLWRLLRKRING